MAKNKYFDFKNIVISAKGLTSSIITFVLVGIIVWLFRATLVNNEMRVIALTISLVGLIIWFLTWGYFSNKIWGWK